MKFKNIKYTAFVMLLGMGMNLQYALDDYGLAETSLTNL